ncbi:helix-turn-helix domain-containing protein [Methylobacterium sp. WL64]|uniref:helix-turn-helix domain-containing protein n=1 Tax=Methylobacterium sp. WL64 TaxID=2603894 RepID=UPI001AEEE498|nr:helix-turn-helix domain-containing protein [Methylobacterium sp. WL64]
MDIMTKYFDRYDLADALGVHVRTLDRWHRERRGPPRTIVGRQIMYRGEAVEEWLRANEQAAVRVPASARR